MQVTGQGFFQGRSRQQQITLVEFLVVQFLENDAYVYGAPDQEHACEPTEVQIILKITKPRAGYGVQHYHDGDDGEGDEIASQFPQKIITDQQSQAAPVKMFVHADSPVLLNRPEIISGWEMMVLNRTSRSIRPSPAASSCHTDQ